ncbi:ParA family protein [Brevibacillus laterosporus]|uniref:ParA family protein n=1 Tax=Brevibacillus laterosporus TaxID=1465 RepID=UPI00215BD028|nr:ParA family protein [Brevibacillus laterosporus]MCR8994630.1 ParA family protein [Brevibacillus laterosporus]
MAKVITVGIQKGGSAKTTSTAIFAYILSQKGYRVLAVDMDSQGNLTQMITEIDDVYMFRDKTVLEALKELDARPFIVKMSDNLHVLPSNDFLATFANYIYSGKSLAKNKNVIMKETLESVADDYDFILIDTPPALGEQTINSICASDYVIAMYETSKFCHSALPRFYETVISCRMSVNPNLKVLGMLRTLIDGRRTDNKYLMQLVEEEYKGICFSNIITRTASVGRISIMGFVNNTELNSALSQYVQVVDEMLDRIENKQDVMDKWVELIERKLVEEWSDEEDNE